jgi:hypothetical protein
MFSIISLICDGEGNIGGGTEVILVDQLQLRLKPIFKLGILDKIDLKKLNA